MIKNIKRNFYPLPTTSIRNNIPSQNMGCRPAVFAERFTNKKCTQAQANYSSFLK